MKLEDTAHLMFSSNYKKRFCAEYYQLLIRLEKLNALIAKYNEHNLNFTLNCPIELLKAQSYAMQTYLYFLNERIKIEDVDIHDMD